MGAGRQKYSIGQVFETIEIAAHADFALDLVVEGRKIRIIGIGPIPRPSPLDRPLL